MPDGAVSAFVRRRACEACNRLVLVSELSRTGRCTACAGLYLRVNGPRASARTVDVVARFEKDPAAIAFVEAHPDGATLAEVGDAFGVSRERIRQIEADALQSLRRRCALAGISAEDLAAVLARRGAGTEHMDPTSVHGGVAGYTSRTGSESQHHRHAKRAEPLPEELYSPHGVRLTAAVDELDERAALLDELVRRADCHDAGVDPGPFPAALLVERPAVAPPLEAQEETEDMPMPAKLVADQHGTEKTLAQWGAEYGVSTSAIRTRVLKGYWPDGSLKDVDIETPKATKPKARKPARARDVVDVARDAIAQVLDVEALSPVDLLTASGFNVEQLGTVPRGRLVLILDSEASAS